VGSFRNHFSRAAGRNPPGTIEALDPVLQANRIADHHRVPPAQLPELSELPEPLVDPRLDRSNAQPLGQSERIALVVLRTTALPDTGNNDLLNMRCQHLVKPAGVGPFLQTQVPRLGNRLQEADQRSGVGLEHLGPQSPTTGTDDGDRAA
jgi:hypothetical protein